MGRPAVGFVAWSPVSGREAEIAEALGGQARCFYPRWLSRRSLTPLRYAVSVFGTIAYLAHRRPRAVIATNPPIFPGLLALVYGWLASAPVLLDSHPSAFGRKGDRLSARLLPVHAWLTRKVTATLVTTEDWVRQVSAWGGWGQIVHEAPSGWAEAQPRALPAHPVVLFAGVFAADEPVAELMEAARRLPAVELQVTGDLRRCPPSVRAAAPENVTFLGFLAGPEYRQAVGRADVVLALTTEPTSVMRAAYEAVYAGRPLVVSDWPVLEALFPHAVRVGNHADGIAAGLSEALRRHAELAAACPAAGSVQRERWERQLTALSDLIGAAAPGRQEAVGPGLAGRRRGLGTGG
jgi:glycosyltransferase involved in cell wall biosynthesis